MGEKQAHEFTAFSGKPTRDDLAVLQNAPATLKQLCKIPLSQLSPAMVGMWGAPTEITISSGVATLTGPGYYKLISESGASDTVTQFQGLEIGDEVLIEADSGHTILIESGTYIKGSSFTLNSVYDFCKVQCVDTNTVRFTGRQNNGG